MEPEQLSSTGSAEVLNLKFEQFKKSLDICHQALLEIESVSTYAFFNAETRIMIEAQKESDRINIFSSQK
jgi:hypothetical protein